MDNESVEALRAEYELQSTNKLFERLHFYEEQADFMHSRAATRGKRIEARARFHINLIRVELARRTGRVDGPAKPRGTSLGDLLAAKGQKLERA